MKLKGKSVVVTGAVHAAVMDHGTFADRYESKFEKLVDSIAVYCWRCSGGSCLLPFCGMFHRKLCHYFQPDQLYALYGTDGLAAVRRIQRRLCGRLQPMIG